MVQVAQVSPIICQAKLVAPVPAETSDKARPTKYKKPLVGPGSGRGRKKLATIVFM